MATSQSFKALAEKNGITAEYMSGRKRHPRTGEPVPFHIELEAPAGKIFAGSLTHTDNSLSGEYYESNTHQADWERETKALEEVIAAGFDECDGCDWCEE